jgi:D-arabinose 1-dehydrogenase-like Zn-dependent alcohol dehydrogenase
VSRRLKDERKRRAAVMMKANAPLEIKEFELSDVGKGWILVRIKCCTICGSDLHGLLPKTLF